MCGCLLRAPYWGPGPATQACALTGNQTGDSLVHRPALNPLSHTSQGSRHFCLSWHLVGQGCWPPQYSPTRNYPIQNVNSAEVEKPWTQNLYFCPVWWEGEGMET